MWNRKEALKRLFESDRYKTALARARTEEERKAIAAMATEFVGSMADVLEPLISRAKVDPSFAEQLNRAVAEGRGLVTASGPAMSGSVG